MMLPRSKKSLDVRPDGTYDTADWAAAMQEHGVAARLGDMVQITGVQVTDKRLVLTINYGLKGGAKWWHKIQVSGGGQRNDDLGRVSQTNAPGGTEIALFFEDGLPDKTTEEFKALLKNVVDFEIRSATEQYMDTIEPKFKKAIEENEVIAGMDKEMVLLAKNRPDSKYRDTRDGVETEDWIYGKPPGDIVSDVPGRQGRISSTSPDSSQNKPSNVDHSVREISSLNGCESRNQWIWPHRTQRIPCFDGQPRYRDRRHQRHHRQ
jgi:hypothetical protein